MTDGKKDILEMDFGKLTVPEAIGVTSTAIAKTVADAVKNDTWVGTNDANDRIVELNEKLEARIQDALDAKNAPAKEAELEALDEENIDWSDVVLLEDGALANIKGVVYQKSCNAVVVYDNESDTSTYCIKRWDHEPTPHEDIHGRTID